MPSARRLDKHGELRVIALPRTFDAFVERGFGRMRQYLARDMNAATHAFVVLARVARSLQDAARLEPLRSEAQLLMSLAEQELKGPCLDQLRERYAEVAPVLRAIP